MVPYGTVWYRTTRYHTGRLVRFGDLSAAASVCALHARWLPADAPVGSCVKLFKLSALAALCWGDSVRSVTPSGGSRIRQTAQPTENAMLRILLSFSSVLAACAPSFHDSAVRKTGPVSGTAVQSSSEAKREGEGMAAVLEASKQEAGDRAPAVQGPITEPVSAAENAASPMLIEPPADALGRRTLSTAFVMVGPDGHLTVELRNGRLLVLRNVLMRPKDYCGEQVLGGLAGKQYCGRYADVAGARPGGAPPL